MTPLHTATIQWRMSNKLSRRTKKYLQRKWFNEIFEARKATSRFYHEEMIFADLYTPDVAIGSSVLGTLNKK